MNTAWNVMGLIGAGSLVLLILAAVIFVVVLIIDSLRN